VSAKDLGSDDALPPAEDPSHTAFVCVEVIEHVERPDRLLAKLQAALAPGMPAVISTPDRDRTHGPGHLGPPPNPQHAQEWTLDELRLLLADHGFPNADLQYVGDPDPRTILAVL
jgi:hypothetical protein